MLSVAKIIALEKPDTRKRLEAPAPPRCADCKPPRPGAPQIGKQVGHDGRALARYRFRMGSRRGWTAAFLVFLWAACRVLPPSLFPSAWAESPRKYRFVEDPPGGASRKLGCVFAAQPQHRGPLTQSTGGHCCSMGLKGSCLRLSPLWCSWSEAKCLVLESPFELVAQK